MKLSFVLLFIKGIKIVVSNAKAHSERGRVERRIHALRESLEKLGVNTTVPMTCMQWETLFSRISNALDNLPLARGNRSNRLALGYEIITPNRLKLGRNNARSLEGSGIDLDMSRWNPGKLKESRWNPGKVKESRWNPGKLKESRRNPGKLKESRWNPGELKESRWNPGELKESSFPMYFSRSLFMSGNEARSLA